MDKKVSETTTNPDLFFSDGKGKTKQITETIYDENEKWIREYIEQYGVEPSFF